MSHGRWRAAATTLAAAVLVLLPAGAATAHPLGNFTTNSYLGVTVSAEQIAVDHVLDLAEIPTIRAAQLIDVDEDGDLSEREVDRYRQESCAAAASATALVIDGVDVPLSPSAGGAVTFPPGEAGLDTLRLECPLAAEHVLDRGLTEIEVRQPDAGGVGWHEITLAGDGVTVVDADVPAVSMSDRLSAYPEDRIASPLDVRTATATVQPGGSDGVELVVPTAVPEGIAQGFERVNLWFTGLVAVEQLSVRFAVLAVVVAMGLGTLHALAPGHGKTVMAAYLVGRQGTPRDALLLGATVAITHTFGVFLLGVILSATQTVSPERIYPWLGAGSGALFAVVGVTLLRQALRNRSHGHVHTHDHGHAHGHDHGHHDGHAHRQDDDHAHGHDHDPADAGADVVEHLHAASVHTELLAEDDDLADAHAARSRSNGWRTLLAPGLAGGLVPSPSALLVLLGGFAIGRAWFGVGLVLAYGIGMAATLVGAGYALLRARHRIQRAVEGNGRWAGAAMLFRWLPIGTSSLIVVGGIVIVVRSLLVL